MPKITQRWEYNTIRRKGGENALIRDRIPIPKSLFNRSTLTKNAAYLLGANTTPNDYYNLYIFIRA